ncbi:MAG: DUF2271 domain-containing protein [Planctomycetota bacterium]
MTKKLLLLGVAALCTTVAIAADSDDAAKESTRTNEPGLHVWFSLDRPSGSRYRKPYLAVWLEDEDGFPVKTATLWWQTEQPGPRWHRDLTRWYRNDRMRKIVEKTDLVDGISGATRGPGDYETHFDGTDNSGKRLPPGKYTLCLEAARENGTYKIIRRPIDWGDTPIARTELKGNIEIPHAAFEFRPGAQASRKRIGKYS